ncbi:hypothetical protein D3C80_2222880 [compost metagenome]
MNTATSAMNIAPMTSALKRVIGRDSTVSTQMPTIARMIVEPVRSSGSLTPRAIAPSV